jgi:hypothetical protein
MASSLLTFFMANPIQSGSSAGLLDLSTPAASTSTTGWTVGKIAAGNYSRLTYNSEIATGNFTTTVQPSGVPISVAGRLAEDCWRTSAATTGDFSTGTWYSSISAIAVSSGGDQDGRARFRIWRSANADGTGATEITQGAMVGVTITNLGTTVAQPSSASTRVVAFSLANEYLFLQVAWEITGAGAANARDVLIRYGSMTTRNGSGLATSLFSATGAASAALGTGYLQNYYRHQVQGAF